MQVPQEARPPNFIPNHVTPGGLKRFHECVESYRRALATKLDDWAERDRRGANNPEQTADTVDEAAAELDRSRGEQSDPHDRATLAAILVTMQWQD
jgi:DNA-binding ferritin-like protein